MSDEVAIDAHQESLVEGDADGAVVVGGVDLLATVDRELWSVTRSVRWLRGATSGLRGVAEVDGGTLVLADDGLLSVSEEIARSPLDDALAVQGVAGTSGAAVLASEDALHGWQNDALRELELGGAPGGVAAGGGMLWVQSGRKLYGIEAASWEEVDRVKLKAEHLAVDSDGTLWASEGDTLHRGPDTWTFPAEITGLCAWTGAWVEADGRLWRVDGERVAVHDGSGLLTCDALGRAVLGSETELTRLADGRPIGLVGLGSELDGDTAFEVIVTGDGVASAEVDIDGQAVELVDRQGVVEALDWFDGSEHVLTARVVYDDAVEAQTQQTFRVLDLGEVGFEVAVEPIYQEACSTCHANGTETELEGYDNWVDNFDAIVGMVDSDAMPLGRDPLTGAQKATIKAWGQEGFAP